MPDWWGPWADALVIVGALVVYLVFAWVLGNIRGRAHDRWGNP